MKIILEYEIEDFWATPEDLNKMSNDEIKELMQEDILSMLDGSKWHIKRDKFGCPLCGWKTIKDDGSVG